MEVCCLRNPWVTHAPVTVTGSCTLEGDQEFCCGLVLDTKSLSEFPHQLSEDSGCRTRHREPLPCPGRGGWCPVGGRAGRGTGGWCQPAPLSWNCHGRRSERASRLCSTVAPACPAPSTTGSITHLFSSRTGRTVWLQKYQVNTDLGSSFFQFYPHYRYAEVSNSALTGFPLQ